MDSLEPRLEARRVSAGVHGSLDLAELARRGLSPEEVLDFSVNSNPYGPSPAVSAALARVPLDRYPDRECLALRQALSGQLNVSPDQIVAGNGTADLLWLLALAFLQARDSVLVVGPTFGEYSRAAALVGATCENWTAEASTGFAVDAATVEAALHRTRPRLAFVCNPNNPTGRLVPLEVIASWARAHPRTLFVVDEAYGSFAAGACSALILNAANVLVLSSMTKDHALAGLRLGYLAGPEALVAAVAAVRAPWSVNALAQAAGVAALSDPAHLAESLAKLRRAKTELLAGLCTVGLRCVPSTTHFFLVQVGDGAALCNALLDKGILVRDCASFGLPAYVRIATRRPEENARLLAALREVLTCRA
jgi:histidinol-phosphate aminotransferase